MRHKVVKSVSVINTIAILIAVAAPFFATQDAKALSLGNVSLRLDRMAAGVATGGTVCARPTSVDTETLVKVTFPAGFVLNATPANWAVTTTNLPNGTTIWPGITAPSLAPSGQAVTFGSGELTVGTTYCFNFSETNTLTNPTAGIDKIGSITTQKAGPVDIDSASYALAIISNDTVMITATVPPNFSFAITGGSAGVDTFSGSLSPSSIVSTAGKTGTVITNASNGWVAWVKSANAGLSSASTGASIPVSLTVNDNTPTTLSAGTTGYVVSVTYTDAGAGSTGVVSQAANFGAEFAGTATAGGSPETSFRPIVAASGITAGDTFTMVERVAINALQPAASDYTDTLTVIAAGRF